MQKLPSNVVKTLQDPTIAKVFANQNFDIAALKLKHGIDVKGQCHDVLVMAHLLDENAHSYSLDSVATTYTDMNGIKDVANTIYDNPAEVTEAELVVRVGLDSDATLRAFNTIKSKLNEDKLLVRYYRNFIMPTLEMLTDTYFHGCKVDTSALKDSEQEAISTMDVLHRKAILELPPAITEKYKDNISLSRSAMIQDYLFLHKQGLRLKPNKDYITEKTSMPQTTEEHLKLFSHIPFVRYLLEWKKIYKLYNSYLNNVWNYIREDGSVYPSTLINRTYTGRTTIYSPAIQTYPARGSLSKLINKIFIPDDGWVFGARDLSTSEMRIIGWLAGDKNILGAINSGIDIHKRTASAVFKVPVDEVTDKMRQASKATGFGFIYSMMPYTKSGGGFKRYAKDLYSLEYTEQECVDIRDAFFSKPDGYYMLPAYHDQQKKSVRKHGYVRSPLGRLRRLPDAQQDADWSKKAQAERQAINMPTQSFSSDIALIGMFLFNQEINTNSKFKGKVKPMWFIHDAIKFRSKEDIFSESMSLLKDCMENRSKEYVKKNFNLEIGYRIDSDGKVGKNMAEMNEYKGE